MGRETMGGETWVEEQWAEKQVAEEERAAISATKRIKLRHAVVCPNVTEGPRRAGSSKEANSN